MTLVGPWAYLPWLSGPTRLILAVWIIVLIYFLYLLTQHEKKEPKP